MRVLERTTRLAADADTVYAWHARPGAIERLTPPWEAVRVLESTSGIEEGARAVLQVGAGPVWLDWVAEHREHREGRSFRDVQVKGPFARWEHLHEFLPANGGCLLRDRVEYQLPGGRLADGLAGASIQRRLDRAFAYRHRVTARDLALHSGDPRRSSRRFLISGTHGLLGSAIAATLGTGGHDVVRLLRVRNPVAGAPYSARTWDARTGSADDLSGMDCVVHLAGANIAAGRWTAARRRAIRDSRVQGTRRLAEILAAADDPPPVLICASAIGFYGDRGDETVDESSSHGSGFLSDVCQAWEKAAEPARQAGIRVVHLRFGIVLTPAGGALATMLPPFRFGVGGRLGDGRQFMSWISLDDAVGAVLHAERTSALEGPVNVVAPTPVRNAELTRALARVLRRPAAIPVPATLIRRVLGDMGQELLLAGARVVPGRLQETGFAYRDPDLESALRHVLGRIRPGEDR